jgi:hypothetical protein
MEQKYKVGDILRHYYYDGTIGNMVVEFIKFDEDTKEPIYCNGTKILYRGLYESDVIGVEPHDEEEYQLYLKLKEKYGQKIPSNSK